MAHKIKSESKMNSDTDEQAFRLLFENHPIPMFIYDLKTLMVLRVNDAMLDQYGYSQAEFQEMTLKDIHSIQDAARLLEVIKNKKNDFFYSGEWQHQSKDGGVIDVDITSHALDFGERPAILAMAQDITERKRAEQAEKHYHSLFDDMLDGIYRSTPEGKFIYVNQAMVKMFGYSSVQEMLEVDIVNELYFEPEERRSTLEKTADTQTEVYRMRRKDGSEIWVEDRETYLYNEQEKTIYHGGMLRDVTTRKQAEQALRESENRYQLLFNSMLDGYYRSTHDGKFIDVNPAMVKMFGYSNRQEMLEIDIKSELYFSPDERGTHILDTGQGETDIFRLRRKDGSEIWIEDRGFYVYDEQGSVLYHEGVMRDITERKHADEIIRESEERLAAVIEGSQLGYSDWNIQTGKVQRNERWAGMLGYTLKEIETTYQQWDDLIHPDDRAAALQALQNHLDGKTPIHRDEYRLRAKDGSYRWILDRGKVIQYDPHGHPLRMTATHTDITERKLVEDELRSAKESLERTNRELEHVLMREQQLARTDGLTGLYNYRYFFELASYEFSASVRYKRPLAVLMFDTDNFKQINDTLGHAAGDRILNLVAQTTASQMRTVDVLARYGGDEFVVLLAQTSAQQAFPIAERIRASVEAIQMQTEQDPLTVTLSIGIAEIWRDPADESVESVVQRADKALYTAKQTGRNRTVIFDAE